MKRSEINSIMKDALEFLEEFSWSLPEWASWSLEQWQEHYRVCEQIFKCNLGWDITDFGSNDFKRKGLFLFTLRNGIYGKSAKTYAEKIMIVRENQETPLHFHWNKMEDIINRGGGKLQFQLYKASENEELSDESFDVYLDDRKYHISAGETISLNPGQSLCLEPFVYHRFYGAPGEGDVLVGEVSQVNDDSRDNRFYDNVGRFPLVEEDEKPLHYLVSDYEAFKKEFL
ncbi:D-lyxose/D-mannose family sugar isomerase [Oceanispirochaeta sp.]|uniref:D-lyxose/D-mannose family sugar isomerase n=1 Tax=Oceanispirochaeta sp. TaxID=2035350 RepID=UPI00262F93A9|nr:D-lyxose/D-mannose family sugar isomerase [Oceanispirochaeta sp.]MDA3956616.1 D-lyxose/D-mannose family sugar isomerase [Oceanispirochaeta sp.]